MEKEKYIPPEINTEIQLYATSATCYNGFSPDVGYCSAGRTESGACLAGITPSGNEWCGDGSNANPPDGCATGSRVFC